MNGVRVLVIEDEPLLRDAVRLALEDAGFDVATAATGEAAITLLKNGASRISALVTDINLAPKGLSGWDVARAAREVSPDLPIVYVTAAAGTEWAAYAVPNSLLITKPFADAQLIMALVGLLNDAAMKAATDTPAA